MAKHYLVQIGSFLCEPLAPEWDGTIPAPLAEAGFEVGRLGAIHHTAYRCPVNGDGYRYSVQDVCDSTGRVVRQVRYYGPGAVSGEI